MPIVSIKLNGEQYNHWAHNIRHMLMARDLWDYICGTAKPPQADEASEEYKKSLKQWSINNSKVLSWIINSVDSSMGANLYKFDVAKDAWDYLSKMFQQSNAAKNFQLGNEIEWLIKVIKVCRTSTMK